MVINKLKVETYLLSKYIVVLIKKKTKKTSNNLIHAQTTCLEISNLSNLYMKS